MLWTLLIYNMYDSFYTCRCNGFLDPLYFFHIEWCMFLSTLGKLVFLYLKKECEGISILRNMTCKPESTLELFCTTTTFRKNRSKSSNKNFTDLSMTNISNKDSIFLYRSMPFQNWCRPKLASTAQYNNDFPKVSSAKFITAVLCAFC